MKIDYKKREILNPMESATMKVEYLVERTKLELQSAILSTRQELEDRKARLEDAKHSYPLDLHTVIDLSDQVEDYEAGYNKLLKLQEELDLK